MKTPTKNTLVLVPTALESRLLTSELSQRGHKPNIHLCGFGPIVAAARTSALIAQQHPELVLLVGIAGAYVDQLETGEAYLFGQVGCHGVGVGSGDSFQTASEIGWQQWQGNAEDQIGDQLALTVPGSECDSGLILTVTSAAASVADCTNRLRQFPNAVAEDMEAFGVAAACKLAGVPLAVVRGISNRAGDRDKKNWQLEQALLAAASLVTNIIERIE